MIKEIAVTAGIAAAIGLGTAGLVEQNSQRNADQSQVAQLRAQITQLRDQLSQAEARLNAGSLTGDLISCTDMRDFEQNIQVAVNGTDAYGNALSLAGIASSSWLPGHCYKQ